MEASNMMALREVVERIVKSLSGKMAAAPAAMTSHEVAILNQCRAALAALPRNCDVGTVQEQYDRHDKYCCNSPHEKTCTSVCIFCYAKWAQMPYEEGGK